MEDGWRAEARLEKEQAFSALQPAPLKSLLWSNGRSVSLMGPDVTPDPLLIWTIEEIISALFPPRTRHSRIFCYKCHCNPGSAAYWIFILEKQHAVRCTWSHCDSLQWINRRGKKAPNLTPFIGSSSAVSRKTHSLLHISARHNGRWRGRWVSVNRPAAAQHQNMSFIFSI